MNPEECQVTRVEKGDITFHVFTSPLEGEGVNSQIVETPHDVVVIDVPCRDCMPRSIARTLESLGKPIAKVFATHAHPDHWFCLGHYQDHPIYAFPEAIAEMEMLRELAIGYHRSIHP